MPRASLHPAPPWAPALAVLVLAVLAAEARAQVAPGIDQLVQLDRAQAELPGRLDEVSGLAVDDAGDLWAHNDERGAIYRLDPASGEVSARRILGPPAVEGDFEGLAWDGTLFHLVTSTGTILSFAPGDTEQVERFGTRETAAGSWCEVEGLAFDPGPRTLIMACKTIRQDDLVGGLVLLEVELPPGPTERATLPMPVRAAVVVAAEALESAGLPESLSASGVERHPVRDSWLVVAAREDLIVEVSRDGRVLGSARLRGHPQTEGVAIGAEGSTLWLSDEARNGSARLTTYGAPTAVGRPQG